MTEGDLTCGKCKTLLIIDAAHVTFKGGRTAYIKCPNTKCNNTRRVTWDLVEHLKPTGAAVESVKPEIPEIKAAEHGLTETTPKETPIKSPSIEPENNTKNLETRDNEGALALDARSENPSPPIYKEPEINEPGQETEGGVIWGAVAALLAFIITIVAILWHSWKNRKQEV